MWKKVSSIVMMSVLLLASLAGCGVNGTGKNEAVSKVVLNEVAHSIFYAPMYVAIEEGYFEEEGIAVELVTGFGADKTMTAVLSGEADIGFMGSEGAE